MKLVKPIVFAVVCSAILFSLNSCQKGDTGPAGQDGSSNVTVETFTVVEVASDTTLGAVWIDPGSYYEHIRKNITALTPNVVESGAVMLYVQVTNGWRALPWTFVIATNTEVRTYNFTYTNYQVSITIEETTGTDSWLYPITGYTYKLVIIPPSARKMNPNLNLNDYEAVQKAYNLKD